MSKPNELFKYRDFGRNTISSLLTEGIWIPKPTKLNDPFDTQLKMTYSDVSFEQFKSAYLSSHESNMKGVIEYVSGDMLESLFKDNKPSKNLREEIKLFSQWWDELSEKMGILSLSEDPKSTTMWSHYADEHTGICIGFNPQKVGPKSQFTDEFLLRKVDYLEEHEITRNAYLLFAKVGVGINFTNDFVLDQFLKAISTKSIDWKYEKEWRFCCPELGGDIYQLNTDAISSITFGLRTSKENKNIILHLLKYHKMKIQCFQTIRREDTIGLDRISLNVKPEYWEKQYEEY